MNALGHEQALHKLVAPYNTHATLGGGTEWFAVDRQLRGALIALVEAL